MTVGTDHLTVLHVSWLVVLSYVGGVLAGALVGVIAWQVRRRIDDPMLENIAILVTPFAAFLLAESIHASGVLAVVVCGLLMSQLASRVTGAVTRQQTTAFWSLATTVLSSALFVLVGQQAHAAARELTSASVVRAIGFVFATAAVVIAARWAWLYNALRLALIAPERDALLQLRDGQQIDDIVLRQVQDRLDVEEVRLLRAPPPE